MEDKSSSMEFSCLLDWLLVWFNNFIVVWCMQACEDQSICTLQGEHVIWLTIVKERSVITMTYWNKLVCKLATKWWKCYRWIVNEMALWTLLCYGVSVPHSFHFAMYTNLLHKLMQPILYLNDKLQKPCRTCIEKRRKMPNKTRGLFTKTTY